MKLSFNDLRWFLQSIELDYLMLINLDWGLLKKLEFIFKKYFLIIKHFFVEFNLSENFIYLDGEKYYYADKFGLAGYQSLLVRHKKMMELAEIKEAKNIIDIGANVGCFSLICSEMFPSSKIIAFEPIPKTYKSLKDNSTGKNIIPVNMGILDKRKNLKMTFDENNSSVSEVSSEGTIDVKVDTLDNITQKLKIKKIDILKVDVEGWENLVLKGAGKSLENVKYLFIEITIKNNQNYTISSLFSQLYSSNFDFQLVAYRNFSDKSFGEMAIMDTLLINNKYQTK